MSIDEKDALIQTFYSSIPCIRRTSKMVLNEKLHALNCLLWILISTSASAAVIEQTTISIDNESLTTFMPYKYNRHIFFFLSENATVEFFKEILDKLYDFDDYCGGENIGSHAYFGQENVSDCGIDGLHNDFICSLNKTFSMINDNPNEYLQSCLTKNISAGTVDQVDVNNVFAKLLWILGELHFPHNLITQVVLVTDYATCSFANGNNILKHLKSQQNITFIALTTNLPKETAYGSFPNDTWKVFSDYMSWMPESRINPICGDETYPYTTPSPQFSDGLELYIYLLFSIEYIHKTQLTGVIDLILQLTARRWLFSPCQLYRYIFVSVTAPSAGDEVDAKCLADPIKDGAATDNVCSTDLFMNYFGANASYIQSANDVQNPRCGHTYERFFTAFHQENLTTLEKEKYLLITDLPLQCVGYIDSASSLLRNYSFFQSGAPLTVIAIDNERDDSVAKSYEPLFLTPTQRGNLYRVNDIDELLSNFNTSINFCLDPFAWHNLEPAPQPPYPKTVWYFYLIGAAILIAIVFVFAIITIVFLLRRKWKRDGALRQIMELMEELPKTNAITNQYNNKRPTTDSSTMKDAWEVSLHSLDIDYKTFIGKGAFSIVHSGFLQGKAPVLNIFPSMTLQQFANCDVAIKTVPQHCDESDKKKFQNEIELMKEIGYHVHLISMLGCNCSIERPILLLELAEQSLLDWLTSSASLMETETDLHKTLLSISWQVSDGMNYLSSKRYVHRDLAARNILLNTEMKAMISDFGLCQKLNSDEKYRVIPGGKLPLKWMALESIEEEKFSLKSDVWSFGVLLFEIFTLGQEPYMGISSEELCTFLERGKRLQKPELTSDQIYDLMRKCWHAKPLRRPDFFEIQSYFVVLLENSTANYGYLTTIEQEL